MGAFNRDRITYVQLPHDDTPIVEEWKGKFLPVQSDRSDDKKAMRADFNKVAKDYSEMVSIESLGFVRITPEDVESMRCKAKEYLFK